MKKSEWAKGVLENFREQALENYDFMTCQRSDGSYYGTGGTCRKGTPAEKPEKDEKKEGGGGGGSGQMAKDLKSVHGSLGNRGPGTEIYEDVIPPKDFGDMSPKQQKKFALGVMKDVHSGEGPIQQQVTEYGPSKTAAGKRLASEFKENGKINVTESDIKVKVTKNEPDEDDSAHSMDIMVFGNKYKLDSSSTMAANWDDPNYTLYAE